MPSMQVKPCPLLKNNESPFALANRGKHNNATRNGIFNAQSYFFLLDAVYFYPQYGEMSIGDKLTT
jgi:hypothetical protein